MTRAPLRRGLRPVLACCLLAACALSSPAAAWGETERRLAVIVALTVNATEERSSELAVGLAKVLGAELGTEVIAGARVEAALPKPGIEDGCIAEPACVRELGARLGADELLALVVVELGSRTQVEPTWIDAQTGRTVSRPAMAFEEDENPAELFRRRARKLIPRPPAKDRAASPDAAAAVHHDEAGGRAPGRRMTPMAYAAAGAGLAALGGGIGFAWATRSLYRSCERDGCAQGDRGRIRRRALAADALITTAALSGGAAAALYWWSRSRGERDVHVGPGPATLGLSVGGRF